MISDIENKLKKKYKYLMGTHIESMRPEIGTVDVISGNFIIIDTVKGFDNWKNESKKKFLQTADNLYTFGEIYNKLSLLTCGVLYSAQDIEKLESIDECVFYELIKNNKINTDTDHYYIYYFYLDYIYCKDIIFLILPYLDENLIANQANFVSYQLIKKNEIYTHITNNDDIK